jgi:pumilio RNA-binding family
VDPESLPSACLLIQSAALSDLVAEQLESCDRERLGVILSWLQKAALELALSASGCRVMQKAFEVAGGEERTALVDQLRGHAVKLVESPHGNHVLQKCIETLPTRSVQFVVDELSAYHGGWASLARHRFGCRVAERLIEQLPEEMIDLLTTAVIADTHTLCYHPFGNYVVQHVLEYGSKKKRALVVKVLIQEDVVSLAQHKVANNVVEKVVEHCGPEEQQTLAKAILAAKGGLLAMGCSRYGAHTARRLLEVLQGQGSPLYAEALCQLQDSVAKLRSSKYGRALAQRVQAGASCQPFQV